MPPPKKSTVQHLQNFLSRQGATPQVLDEELNFDPGSNNPIALSSKVMLDNKIPTSESPEKLARSLDGLMLEAPLLEDNIVLEELPNNETDPVYYPNHSSLVDPEEHETANLPPPPVKEPEGEPTNQKQISHEDTQMMLDKLSKLISLSLHRHGKMHISTLGNVVLT
ncbi:unnamed protein product [Rhizoctonia solani]|uniref:Uncharacterized protein n=1 Tax=Rhizoctonia solani TaxID=456999 RepID=A0A8H2ZWA7_9AGAM|nr:unnamed protein product [Rhizoctonia solani]